MRMKLCVACGATEDLQHHHLIPRSDGGGEEENNLITLCTACHFKLHSRQMNGMYNASQRVRAALAVKKAQGKKLGGVRPKTIMQADARAEALRPVLRELGGKSANAIAKELNAREIKTPSGRPWHAQTVIRVQRRLRGEPS